MKKKLEEYKNRRLGVKISISKQDVDRWRKENEIKIDQVKKVK